jgi:ribose-phosphate pyrophosphokinase
MTLVLVAGSGNIPLAEATAKILDVPLNLPDLEHFPDGEQHVRLNDSVRGADVFVLQPTSPPVDKNLVELLFLCDAARRAGADKVTAIIPYLGYARQDRRARGREALAARLTADMIAAAGAERVVAVDVHSRTIEGFFSIRFEHLSAVPLLVTEASHLRLAPESVIVSPDLGAVKLAETFANELMLPVAVVRKTRLSGSEVSVTGVTGHVRDHAPLIVDDMISTGATIRAAAEAVMKAGARTRALVFATHGLFAAEATAVLRQEWVDRIFVTDSVPQVENGGLALHVVSVAPLLGETIRRLHNHQSLADLIKHE